MSKLRSWKLWAVVGGVVLVLIVIGSIAGGGDGDSTPSLASSPSNAQQTQAIQSSQPIPTKIPVITITAQMLYDEREANATRYDVTYKGKMVSVSGEVVKIDDGDVTLGVDTTGFGIDRMGLVGVDLTDLTTEEQITLNKGDMVSAVCKVGDFIITKIRLRDCTLK